VFVTIFLASWAGYLWINPFGPMVLGVSVAPIFVVGLIFAFILAAVSVPQPRFKRKTPETEEADSATVAIGIFFWIVLIILIVAIAAGYYRLPVNSEQIVN
jgi:small-conductance mechanosensitive channel